jgi:endoribonuclease Dicer
LLVCIALQVKHIEGNTEEATMMNAFLDDYDIFLFTPQILVNNLNSDIKDLSVFSLMILDECHHARGEEPYNTLMKHYLEQKTNGVKGLPQVDYQELC